MMPPTDPLATACGLMSPSVVFESFAVVGKRCDPKHNATACAVDSALEVTLVSSPKVCEACAAYRSVSIDSGMHGDLTA